MTNEQTGGAKGQKAARFGLMPVEALNELAKVYGAGAAKYDDHNWRKGYAYSLSYDAMQRHVTAWWGGESLDPELGTSHLMNAAFHLFSLYMFEQEHPEMDDRFKRPAAECPCGNTLPCVCRCPLCAKTSVEE